MSIFQIVFRCDLLLLILIVSKSMLFIIGFCIAINNDIINTVSKNCSFYQLFNGRWSYFHRRLGTDYFLKS